jgi:hypothetical protein
VGFYGRWWESASLPDASTVSADGGRDARENESS